MAEVLDRLDRAEELLPDEAIFPYLKAYWGRAHLRHEGAFPGMSEEESHRVVGESARRATELDPDWEPAAKLLADITGVDR